LVTKRIPLERTAQTRITPEAIAIFRRLRRARTKEQYNVIGWELHHALGMLPCDARVCFATRDKNPYEEQERGTMGGLTYPAARALYVELEAAARRRARSQALAAKALEREPVP
jgi:hypothetical protein